LIPFASHTACTIEMLSTEEEYEVAVIDEVQMIGDAQRVCVSNYILVEQI
jgi:ATP-dependent RNA helicase SUPV3L1/SUV3